MKLQNRNFKLFFFFLKLLKEEELCKGGSSKIAISSVLFCFQNIFELGQKEDKESLSNTFK